MRAKIAFCVASGTLLGFSYPPFELGVFAAVAFVPLFIVLSTAETFTSAIRISYLTFIVTNLIALYWPGGFVHGRDLYLMVSGGLLLAAHPLFMSVPVAAWFVVRRAFGMKISVFIFPVLWVAFEYLHSVTQFAFPWLSLGNTQTNNLLAIQFITFTGVYGLSFWLLVLNVLFFVLTVKLILGEWRLFSGRTATLVTVIAAIYLAPFAAGMALDPGPGETGPGDIRVSLVQPDTDPFEKWQSRAEQQDVVLMDMTRRAAADAPDLVVWPETALPYYLLSPSRRPEFLRIREFVDSIGIPLLTGIPDITYFDPESALPRSVKYTADGIPYQNFNSAILLAPGSQNLQKYAKTLLVPFAEHVPYSELLEFLNAAQWNFGLGGWSIGRDSTVFVLPGRTAGPRVGSLRDTVRFASLICYESIFPGYVASLVRKGAMFMTIVTNDSWWGRTAGPYQHRQFTVLRAVENRRWFMQCANGGISYIVDPSGRIRAETRLFEPGVLTGSIMPRTEETFYTKHGDWLAEILLVIGIVVTGASLIHVIVRKRLERSP